MTATSYAEFLAAKVDFNQTYGFEVDDGDLHPVLMPHQRAIVSWAVRGGRRAIFAAFGLGKGLIQLEIMRLVLSRTGGYGLIVCPLGVRQEFIRDAAMIGVEPMFVRRDAEVDGPGLYLTNYESIRDGRLDPNQFDVASLDEASVLRSFGSKTYQTFLTLFDQVKYRFLATATPSPNRHKELIHYGGFLGIMDTGQALTRFFQRDSTKANHLTLYPHKTKEFHLWLNTWATFIQRPSDLCRCKCHDTIHPLRENDSAGLSSSPGSSERSDMVRGSADVTAGAPTSPPQLTFVPGGYSVVDAFGRSTVAKGPAPTASGEVCMIAAPDDGTRTGPTMAVEGSPSANGGGSSRTSSATWGSRRTDTPSSESTTAATTSLETADGLPESSKRETADLGVHEPPCDGRCDTGYDLPEIEVVYHEIPVDHSEAPVDRDGQGHLFRGATLGVTDAAREKRSTLDARVAKAAEIVTASPGDHFILWHDLEDERRAIKRVLPEAVEVYGSLDLDIREQRIIDFSDGRFRLLATKPELSGSGCNFQRHCHRAIFVGITFSFNDFVQACHRIHRYLQMERVRIDIIHAESEREVVEPTWVEAAETVGSYVNRKLAPSESPGVEDPAVWWIIGRWLADGHYHVARDSLHISVGNHKMAETMARLGSRAGALHASNASTTQVRLHDVGGTLRSIIKQCGNLAHEKRLPPEAYTLPTELARALLDGYLSGDGHYRDDRRRWMASSVSRELMLGMAYLAQRVHGAIASVYPGRSERGGKIEGRAVRMRAEWVVCFDVPDARRRKRSQLLDDGAWMKVRVAEPVGEVETWNLRVAEDESFTAEGMIVKNCPLQFDIVDRLIRRYSNEGELVYDPFGGLFTVPFRALHLGRRGRSVELNPGYFLDGVKYLQAAERELNLPTLFDLAAVGPAEGGGDHA